MTTTNLLLLFASLGSIDRCDTELCLSPGGVYHRHSNNSSSSSRVEEKAAGKAPQQQEQQITIFYNGQICVCDVTEIQARAIISTAKREMEDLEAKKQSDEQYDNRRQDSSFPPPVQTPPSAAQPQLLNRSLSMKRSLQRFLHNRKTRALDSSPYNHHQ